MQIRQDTDRRIHRSPGRIVHLAVDGEPSAQTPCDQCRTYRDCLVHRLENAPFRELAGLIRHPRPLHGGDCLFRQGELFRGIYLVQTGSIKTTVFQEDGDSWIAGFHFPGEVLGLDALDGGGYLHEAQALETTTVCALPASLIASLSRAAQVEVYQQILTVLTGNRRRHNIQWQTLGRMTADQRLASFLLDMSQRMEEAGKHASVFELHMSRNDIANYLGLAPETLSRLFRRFREEGLIEAARAHVSLRDRAGLVALAGGPGQLCANA